MTTNSTSAQQIIGLNKLLTNNITAQTNTLNNQIIALPTMTELNNTIDPVSNLADSLQTLVTDINNGFTKVFNFQQASTTLYLGQGTNNTTYYTVLPAIMVTTPILYNTTNNVVTLTNSTQQVVFVDPKATLLAATNAIIQTYKNGSSTTYAPLAVYSAIQVTGGNGSTPAFTLIPKLGTSWTVIFKVTPGSSLYASTSNTTWFVGVQSFDPIGPYSESLTGFMCDSSGNIVVYTQGTASTITLIPNSILQANNMATNTTNIVYTIAYPITLTMIYSVTGINTSQISVSAIDASNVNIINNTELPPIETATNQPYNLTELLSNVSPIIINNATTASTALSLELYEITINSNQIFI